MCSNGTSSVSSFSNLHHMLCVTLADNSSSIWDYHDSPRRNVPNTKIHLKTSTSGVGKGAISTPLYNRNMETPDLWDGLNPNLVQIVIPVKVLEGRSYVYAGQCRNKEQISDFRFPNSWSPIFSILLSSFIRG